MSTKYTLFVSGEATDFTRSTKSTVVDEAVAVRADQKVEVEVKTGAGTTVFYAAAPKQRVITVFTKPFTKVVPLSDAEAGLVPQGYAPAYKRPRNGAVVLRRESDIPEDPSRYAVLDTVLAAIVGYAETTRAAGKIMEKVGASRKES